MAPEIIDGIYYEHGEPKHAGVVKVDGIIFYAGSGGVLATGEKTVHSEMTNGLLKRGVYEFDKDGSLIPGSYVPPKSTGKKRRKKRSRRKLTKTQRWLVIASIAALIALIFLDLHFNWLNFRPEPTAAPTTTGETEFVTPIILPEFEEPVYLCTDPMRRYYSGALTLPQAISYNQGAYAPFVFPYEMSEGIEAVLLLDGKEYPLDPNANSISIDNLMTGKTYDYTVTVTETADESTRTTTYPGSFTTADTNRFVFLPGVSNTRDIGHYRTAEGKRVKEGMIIRGTEIDALVEGEYYLTDKSAAEPFGFRSDMDLRSGELYSSVYQSRLGDQVSHRFFNSPSYSGIFTEPAKPLLRDIFAELADPDNYPVYLHCTYGADRTGTIVFLLQGLLGVSEEDMIFEYRLTGFHMSSYGDSTDLNGIFGGLEGTPGDTINEKICSYLIHEVGLTQEQLDSIRAILLED